MIIMQDKRSIGAMLLIAVIGLCLAGIVLLAAFRRTRPVPEAPPEQKTIVTTLTAEARAMDDIVVLPGRIAAAKDLWVAVEQSGRVEEMAADEGEAVRAGDVLLRVDDRLWKAALERAELQAQDARRDLRRMTELRDSGAVSGSDLESVTTRAALAEIALRDTRVQWERCAPTAPFDGTVEERRVSRGEYVQPGMPVFRLVAADRVKILFDAPERDVSAIRTNAVFRFRLPSAPAQRFEGTVRRVATVGKRINHAFEVELTADNPAGLIRPGMIAEVEVKRGTIDDAVILPLQAIVPSKGEMVVFVVEEGRALRRIVRLGAILDAHAVVREGIRAGDEVVLEGNRAVVDGTAVQVQEADPS
jgi:membrane fusion protein, multidrug efflux system